MKNLDHGSCHLLAGRSNAIICAQVSAAPGGAHYDFVFFCDQVFNSNGDIGKTCTHHANIVFDTLYTGWLLGGRAINKFGVEDLVYNGQITGVEAFHKETADKRFVCFCWHR